MRREMYQSFGGIFVSRRKSEGAKLTVTLASVAKIIKKAYHSLLRFKIPKKEMI